MRLECTIVEKISKAGSPYQVLRIDLGQGVKKDFFLNDAEFAILKLNSENQ